MATFPQGNVCSVVNVNPCRRVQTVGWALSLSARREQVRRRKPPCRHPGVRLFPGVALGRSSRMARCDALRRPALFPRLSGEERAVAAPQRGVVVARHRVRPLGRSRPVAEPVGDRAARPRLQHARHRSARRQRRAHDRHPGCRDVRHGRQPRHAHGAGQRHARSASELVRGGHVVVRSEPCRRAARGRLPARGDHRTALRAERHAHGRLATRCRGRRVVRARLHLPPAPGRRSPRARPPRVC
jgi:hypothetical protein